MIFMKVFAPGPTWGHIFSAMYMFDKMAKIIIVVFLYIRHQANQHKLDGY